MNEKRIADIVWIIGAAGAIVMAVYCLAVGVQEMMGAKEAYDALSAAGGIPDFVTAYHHGTTMSVFGIMAFVILRMFIQAKQYGKRIEELEKEADHGQ